MGTNIDLPPGFRFHPTDEEIITSYLREKVIDSNFNPTAIGEVDLNRCEPWDLPDKAKNSGEKEWYFYCQKDRKYPTGTRTNRATESGYWKATGKDKEIYKGKGNLVGMKKTLVFYKGRAPKGEKTNWVMREFRMEGKSCFNKSKTDEWVVCRVSYKNTESPMKKYNQTIRTSSPSSSSSMAATRFDNDLLFDTHTILPLVETNPSHSYCFNRINSNPIIKNNNTGSTSTDHFKSISSTSTTIPIQNENQLQYSGGSFILANPFSSLSHQSLMDNHYNACTATPPQGSSYYYPQFVIPTTTTMNGNLHLHLHQDRNSGGGFTDPNRIAKMKSHGTNSAQGGEGEGSPALLKPWRCKEEQYSNQSLITSSPSVSNDKSTAISSSFPVPELGRSQSFDDINQLLSSAGSLSDIESFWN